MSIYKGNTKIAGMGATGRSGNDGKRELIIEPNHNEIHNCIDEDGQLYKVNTATGGYNSVGGYDCSVSGTNNFVHGQYCHGTCDYSAIFGYGNSATGDELFVEGRSNSAHVGQGGHVEGYYNDVTAGIGSHVEGVRNTISAASYQGIHVEGKGHTTFLPNREGGHQGGYGVNSDSARPIMPHVTDHDGTLEVIGGYDGDVVREMDVEGNMGLAGDLAFVAKDSSGNVIGTYTLGQIVQALIDANILSAPL